VVFTVLPGSGSATGVNQVTDAAGVAAVGSWTLGPGDLSELRPENRLVATLNEPGITGNSVSFTAQSAYRIAITGQPAGPVKLGDNFSITVQLRDFRLRPVSLGNHALSIAISSGAGMLNGTLVQATAANGSATFTINVSGAAGARTFTISGSGLVSAVTNSITFN